MLSDKSLDLLKVVWLRVPNSQGNLNSWHRVAEWLWCPVPLGKEELHDLHLRSGIVQEILLNQETLWRPENYWLAEVVVSPNKKTSSGSGGILHTFCPCDSVLHWLLHWTQKCWKNILPLHCHVTFWELEEYLSPTTKNTCFCISLFFFYFSFS